SSFWPEGIRYDPENDGIIMGSLGICEHWNDSAKKQYSRNLGYNKGIELVSTAPELVKTTVIAIETETSPAFDGEENDICWTEAKWYPIDQTWIIWGQKIDSSDFHGEFKISWSSADNLMYFLVKVTDDAFIDGYVYPGDGYPNFDIVEVFIDEDKSGGLHVFDNNPTWGQNAENAFSYHMATSKPADGETSTNLVACDISGTDWDNRVIENYASHFPDFIMKRKGNVYTYEFSMKVYSDAYAKSNPENSRVRLAKNKLMGMSLAYCDNDDPDGLRDNFFGSVWVPEAEYNDHWMNANGFGSVRLVTPLPETTSVINNNLSGKITIYPNPAAEYLFLTLPAKINNQTLAVEVYSMNGARLMRENFNSKETNKIIQINVGQLKSGSYLIRVILGNDNFSKVFYKK
ncbi:MAG: T9SS type A sorting domain-containing protein, partial [Bacteroidia bacterium]|nr:T9SS type A sorting domain-containing protein [Bacteroidia bacterium]